MAIVASEFYARNRQEWREWLATNHNSKQSVWLIFDKGKNRTLTYDDMVEEALCYGWVDSVPGKVSDTQAKIYVSRRKPKSSWSKVNKQRIEKLLHAGTMSDAGIAAVNSAKQNGSWDALNKSDAFEMPEELNRLLMSNTKARLFYDAMAPSSHKIILEWIYAAKTEDTKMKRIVETVELASQGIKAHHYRQ